MNNEETGVAGGGNTLCKGLEVGIYLLSQELYHIICHVIFILSSFNEV